MTSFEVVVLGSGNATPQPRRASAGHLLTLPDPVVLDFGPGAFRNLVATGTAPEEIGTILISHLHLDHFLEVLLFLFDQTWEMRGKHRKPLRIFGPPGIRHALTASMQTIPLLGTQDFSVEIREVRNESFETAGVRIVATEVRHAPDLVALSYRVEAMGRVVCYSGDSTLCPELVQASKDADLAIFEATYPTPHTHAVHMNSAEACQAAREANVRRLILTHLSPEWDGVDGREQVRGLFEGEVHIAHDLLRVRV
jgi:ribonuclease BN (tRNA processing enzyme)